MVGSNRAFHGKRPYRLWASSYPRSSPGTAIQREPEEQNSSDTPSRSLVCGFHLSESTPMEACICTGGTKASKSSLFFFPFLFLDSEVHGESTRGNRHVLQQGRWQLDIREKAVT